MFDNFRKFLSGLVTKKKIDPKTTPAPVAVTQQITRLNTQMSALQKMLKTLQDQEKALQEKKGE